MLAPSHLCVSVRHCWPPHSHLAFIFQAPMYYRNANCAVVVYDITQSASLDKARTWIRELQRQADPSIVIALCGNKLDLSARRQVTQEEAKKYADEEGLMWTETSAKTGEGVTEIFTAIGELPTYFRHIMLLISIALISSPETPSDSAKCHSRWGRTGRRAKCKGGGRSQQAVSYTRTA